MNLPFKSAPSIYTRYELTTEEESEGYKLSLLTQAVLSNLQATIAEEKLALIFTPNNVADYTQQEAYKAGQLAILAHLLDQKE